MYQSCADQSFYIKCIKWMHVMGKGLLVVMIHLKMITHLCSSLCSTKPLKLL